MNYSAILLCAGSGKRTGLSYNKMFYQIEDKTVYQKMISMFINDQRCTQIIVVCKDEERESFRSLNNDQRITFVSGGKERQNSVFNGLQEVINGYVLIHDGARCFLKKKVIDDILECLMFHDSCLVMVPSIDTIKRVINGKVIQTLDRNELWNAQTPQGFKTSVIKKAYQYVIDHHLQLTDDTSAVELLGCDVYVIKGDYSNKKITTAEDLE